MEHDAKSRFSWIEKFVRQDICCWSKFYRCNDFCLYYCIFTSSLMELLFSTPYNPEHGSFASPFPLHLTQKYLLAFFPSLGVILVFRVGITDANFCTSEDNCIFLRIDLQGKMGLMIFQQLSSKFNLPQASMFAYM